MRLKQAAAARAAKDESIKERAMGDATQGPPISRRPQISHHYRDAMRLLFILEAGSEAPSVGTDDGDSVGVFRGEKRAMAIDFLVRYPDYLADALLDLHQQSPDPTLLAAAKSIFETEEPAVRTVAMIRWRRGAFENIDTALAILTSRGLVRSVKAPLPGNKKQHEFIIHRQAIAFLDQAVMAQPELEWYRDRVNLAMKVVGSKSGTKLKDWQYEHDSYRDAPLGSLIPSIAVEVKERLREFKEE
jgi:hypothetical protein